MSLMECDCRNCMPLLQIMHVIDVSARAEVSFVETHAGGRQEHSKG